MKTSRWTMLVVAVVTAAFALLFGAVGASAAPGGSNTDPVANYGSNPNGLQVGSNSATQGSSVPVSGQGCTPNSTVSFTLDNGTPLGSTETDSSGGYATTVTIPSGTSVGSHTINSSGANCGSVGDIMVTAAGGSGGGSGGLADTGVAVIGIGALGVVLLVGGGLMLLAGRRRRSTV